LVLLLEEVVAVLEASTEEALEVLVLEDEWQLLS
jgi:hypothetical protein